MQTVCTKYDFNIGAFRMLSSGLFTGVCSLNASILQTPVNHPEEIIRHSEHGESLKSRIGAFVGCVV
jgi:hypothetical protein